MGSVISGVQEKSQNALGYLVPLDVFAFQQGFLRRNTVYNVRYAHKVARLALIVEFYQEPLFLLLGI